MVLLTLGVAGIAFAQVNVLNVNYDHQQTGANLQETILSPQMDWTTFGKLGALPVDGQVYAQPLYVSGVAVGGTKYNVLYVATMHNSIFAFNADTPKSATPLWQVNLGASVPIGLFNFTDILPEIGILGTPVIDPDKQILYVVADILPPGAFSNPVFELHALSLVDGHEMLGGPMQIAALVSGTGAGGTNNILAFDAFVQLQRPGLMLANGTIYVGFGSHADSSSFHGWLMAYNASSLQQTAFFNSTPNGAGAAFWHSGRAPIVDSNGDIYAVTGNGTFDGMTNFGESVLRLSGSDLSLLDWFTPPEWSNLNDQDNDLGSAGAILIPNTKLLLTGGKSGLLHLLRDNSMGHLAADGSTVQSVQVNTFGLFTMALWSNAPNGPNFYEFEPGGPLKAFQILNNKINSTIVSEYSPSYYSFFAGLSVSANGEKNGIVWLTTGNDAANGEPGTLHALDATDLARELWNSDFFGRRDKPGKFAKFVGPTVANGRVYVPTFSNAVSVYGQLTAATPATASAAISAVVNSASYLPGAVSPGELVTIFGANLGPALDVQGRLDGDSVADTVENTQVFIGGIASPILFASSGQINTVVPFGVTGTTSQVQVLYQGQPTASTVVQVQPASPAVFSLTASGGGQGAILNQDGSVNASNNPATRGSVVALYATGAGNTKPASVDGLLTTAPYPAPTLPVSVTIDGRPAQILYAGAAPGLVAGVVQIDAVVPADASQSIYDQVVVTVGDYVSPSAVTICVQ